MDKTELYKQIVLLRKIVKKAKVCVTRKLIKQIKILRTCKDERTREKKFKKARRLAAEIHVMRELRPDYVTKFALITENYVPTGSNTKQKRKRNACAKLARHKQLAKEISAIREKFSNWREELPPLLETRKKEKDDKDETNVEDNVKENGLNVNSDAEEEVSNGNCEDKESSNEENETVLEEEPSDREESEDDSTEELPKTEKEPISKNVDLIKTVSKQPRSMGSKKKPKNELNVEKPAKKKESGGESHVPEDVQEVVEEKPVEEKIDDPFFIDKKIVVPKLLQQGSENHPENEEFRKKRKLSDDLEAELKPKRREKTGNQKRLEKPAFQRQGQVELTEDELHPSWKAKKIQMIRPFEGKKIKFD
ncbi:UNVERIFIED_CONTAM: hypothetical protein PYX00_008682 [Menopon gallinae]|uniref:Serum response factor-binding protein 1 n=1 Tax=Menopon gallinae TaxID=328185 RepID=A0AAW2HQC5_9NEOP